MSIFQLLAVCRAERKQSNDTRSLASAIQKGQVPNNWVRYTVPRDVTVMDWMNDFTQRVEQLTRLANSGNLKVWNLHLACSIFLAARGSLVRRNL